MGNHRPNYLNIDCHHLSNYIHSLILYLEQDIIYRAGMNLVLYITKWDNSMKIMNWEGWRERTECFFSIWSKTIGVIDNIRKGKHQSLILNPKIMSIQFRSNSNNLWQLCKPPFKKYIFTNQKKFQNKNLFSLTKFLRS